METNISVNVIKTKCPENMTPETCYARNFVKNAQSVFYKTKDDNAPLERMIDDTDEIVRIIRKIREHCTYCKARHQR